MQTRLSKGCRKYSNCRMLKREVGWGGGKGDGGEKISIGR